jgi:hypothetical protein
MMPYILLTAVTMGYRQALFTGFIPLGTITSRGETAPTAIRIAFRWAFFFLIALLTGSLVIHFAGPVFPRAFIHLEYLLVLFLGIIHLLNLSAKHEHFRNFIYNKRWLYSLGMLQGFSALGNVAAFYSVDDLKLPLLVMACMVYGLAYCIVVSFLAMFIGLITNISHKSRSVVVVLLSILGIVIGILHFFTGMI